MSWSSQLSLTGKHHWFIPTCVGQIQHQAGMVFKNTVHPHVRGADSAWSRPSRITARFIPTCVGQMLILPAPRRHQPGSSPRAWGRFVVFAQFAQERRFIPTCVGQMNGHFCAFIQLYGSSPRAWGRFIEAGEHQP